MYILSLHQDLLARCNAIFFPPDTVLIKKVDSECFSVNVLKTLLDFDIGFNILFTKMKYVFIEQ